MDIVSSCKDKLTYFRIKELKDILTQLGLSKQGKKQDLVGRLLAILSDEQVSGMWAKKNAVGKEEVAKLVDDTYRKMQISGAPDLASKAQCVSDSSNLKVKEEIEVSYQMDKIRCPCGSSLHTDSVIKCADSRCSVWQHVDCVIVPEKPMEGVLPVAPEIFYCELCRLSRADPFWVTVAHPLYPVKLSIENISTDGTNPGQNVEKTFQLRTEEIDLLAKQEYDVQAWCILLNDKVPFRMHWPQHADLQVNGVLVRAINRPGPQLLGANGRDDGPVITPFTRDGLNKISLTGCDARVFCLGVRIVKRRTVQHILNLIPKESDGESFEVALARVRRCVGGGTATENADSDSDLEVVADSIPVNLRCPMSGSRMNVTGRFKPCVHMGCFDLEIFVEMNQRSRKWQCPICLKNYSLEDIIIDPYFNRITSKMHNCGEDVTEIEVKPDGSWRVMAESDRRGLGDLGLWHFPDGTLCPLRDGESKPKPQVFSHVKEECLSEGHNCLNLGIKNRNGFWQVNKIESMQENIENSGHNVIPMSSSATGSGRDCEDHSVNQDDAGNVDLLTNNAVDLDPFSLNVDPNYVFANKNASALLGDPEVIVLSDSEEENGLVISSGPVYKTNQIDAGGVAYTYNDNPSLSLFNTNDDEFEVPLWPLPSGSQGGGSAFQLFCSEADVCMNGYTLTAETGMGSDAIITESTHRSNADIIDVIVDNPLGFGGDDPSLQIFLPTRPSDAEVSAELRRQPDVSNGIRKDWISLGLGGGASGGNGCPAGANVVTSRQHLPSKEGTLDSLADTASLLLGMNDNRTAKPSREISNGPFSFPRQRRSVRPRLYLSIDSDSD